MFDMFQLTLLELLSEEFQLNQCARPFWMVRCWLGMRHLWDGQQKRRKPMTFQGFFTRDLITKISQMAE